MSATAISGVERWAEDSGRMLELPYEPFPKQQRFHASPAKYRLFGGAAGPGKSMALLMEGVLQANEVARASTLLLRRTFPELESSLLLYFRRNVPQSLYKSFNESRHTVEWWNGSITHFGYSKSERDIYQYQGAEYLFIGCDELTHFTLKQWTYLTSRNRCPEHFACMAGATNPGNVGHAWVKALWIDKKPAPGMERPDEYDPANYEFIPALLSDNPIYANDAGYRATLEALPRHLREAFLYGKWDIFAGQYFDIFDPAVHTDRVENMGLQAWYPRWISIDWGFEHPAAVYWHAQDGARTCTYREFVHNKLSPRILGQEIAERSKGERIDAVYLGPDAFAKRTDEDTIAEQLGAVFARENLPRPSAADNDRVGGWMLLYQLLQAGEWIIAENCHQLIACLPMLTRDDKYVEDIQKVDGDDPADAARYGLKSRLGPRKPPLDTRVMQRLAESKVDNPTGRAMLARKFEAEEGKKFAPKFLRRPRRTWN